MAGLSIDRNAAVTKVTFHPAGNYKLRLTVNDGQFSNNTATANIDVAVVDQPPPAGFRWGDVDANGVVEITDASCAGHSWVRRCGKVS